MRVMRKPRAFVALATAAFAVAWLSAAPISSASTSSAPHARQGAHQAAGCSASKVTVFGSGNATAENSLRDGSLLTDSPV